MKNVHDILIDALRRRCDETVAEMWCPVHQRNPRVVIDSERCAPLEIEVFCCCDYFSKRVCEALEETLAQAGLPRRYLICSADWGALALYGNAGAALVQPANGR